MIVVGMYSSGRVIELEDGSGSAMGNNICEDGISSTRRCCIRGAPIILCAVNHKARKREP